ncbi:MAG TPA: FAD-dependent tricarballylate dehydrogenase TcuA [Dehalococcoidia bacterium]|nr:FAD-dependent tricarballylate dehydrogenase TcuA [Dehalococcoidia bacterium]
MKPLYDVVLVGGGNAALCAALEARRAGADVLILEAAPWHLRGGNSRHTRNLRYLHKGPDHYLVGSYEEDEFYADLLQVTGGETNEALARATIRASAELGAWIMTNDVRWQGPLKGTLQLSRTNAFFLGGGKALVNAYYGAAEKLGVEVLYEAEVCDIVPGGGVQAAITLQRGGQVEGVQARSVVVASGGFEANGEWMARQWGEAAANFAVRGTAYNRGRPIQALLDRGARPVGSMREFHAVAVDARGPMSDGGIVTRLDTLPFGIVVNRDGRRFSDEGADFWPKRYASWGGLIAQQPGQVAFSLLDAKMAREFMPSLYPPIEAASIRELATALQLAPDVVEATVAGFNAAVQPGAYDATILDDCHTASLEPAKSHWARALDTPPYLAYPLRPGITFTYHGLSVNDRAQVIATNGEPLPGVYAAGEAMAGNILGRGYLAGFGMTIGSVFGRIAGREAAKHALA